MYKKQAKEAASMAGTLSALVLLSNMLSPFAAKADPVMQIVPTTVSVSTNSKTSAGLNIAAGTTQVIDVSNGVSNKIGGNLSNRGTLYVVSTDPSVSAATLIARNIFNFHGANITTVLPEGGIAGYQNAIPNLSLTLAAIRNIVNNGTISSAQNLNLVAGGSIVNAPIAGAAAGSAILQAGANLNVLSPTLVNHGVIAAQLGSVNIANSSIYTATVAQLGLTGLPASLGNIININNTGGIIQALAGTVGIGSSTFGSKAVISMLGGDIQSPVVNFDAGAGSLKATLHSVDGLVNVRGDAAYFGTTTGTLNLGTVKIDGDPTFFNSGDINIINDVSASETLSILAGGNITALTPFNIVARNGDIGQDIYMVAGAALSVSTPVGSINLPGATAAGQKVSVLGASNSGGTISLAGSLIDTRSGAGDKNGGNVTLIAYPGLVSGKNGGIEGVIIANGGSGKGQNGAVKIIAGGAIGATTTAIQNVRIDGSSGGASLVANPVEIFAAAPLGKPGFNTNGTIFNGNFSKGDETTNDIIINVPIQTGGNPLTISTNGSISNSALISTGSSIAGKGGGDIKIDAGNTLTVNADITASGSNGANSAPAAPGKAGDAGQGGGGGGMITLNGDKGITISANIISNGGFGGAGGLGGDGAKAGQAGGAGGAGGAAGAGGSISLTTKDAAVLFNPGFMMTSIGGDGGAGGGGGKGFSPAILAGTGARGGNGGSGGAAGSGGMLSVKSGDGAVTLGSLLDAHGGNGASGGAGAVGVAGSTRGGAGGSSGIASGGGAGGSLDIITKGGNVLLSAQGMFYGGDGAEALSGGDGGAGLTGGDGGAVANSGDGGRGGRVAINSTTGKIDINDSITLYGGEGAKLSSSGGKGISGATAGGDGGSVGGAGKGGDGGSVQFKTAGAITLTGPAMLTYGGNGGVLTSSPGDGGDGGSGGDGGKTGNSGAGGGGGDISIITTGAALSVSTVINASGGFGGDMLAIGGEGGDATKLNGGPGGLVGSAGNGGSGAKIELISKASDTTVTSDLIATGGGGGNNFGLGGDGGKGAGPAGLGTGGKVLVSGSGGGGGSISVEASKTLLIWNMDASGADAGIQSGQGGLGADGKVGADGGAVAVGGSGGKGGIISLTTSQLAGSSITIPDTVLVFANGGIAPSYEGIGGNGGSGTGGGGGKDGAVDKGGDGGGGGKVLIKGFDFTLTKTGQIHANGGRAFGYGVLGGGYSGNGGNGGGTGQAAGGDSGGAGNGGSGGDGGLVSFDVKGFVALDNGSGKGDFDGFDSIAVRGGSVGDFKAVTGNGGNASATGNGSGGSSGSIGINGSGGDGGSITIKGDKGNVGDVAKLGAVFAVLAAPGGYIEGNYARTGDGGNAGKNGRGGTSGSVFNNGNGGKGGDVTISTSDGSIIITPLIAAGGDIFGPYSPKTGNGGSGGSATGNGGNSGDIGNNGNGGNGGKIDLGTKAGQIGLSGNVAGGFVAFAGPVSAFVVSSPQTGNAGSAPAEGNGGTSGKIGSNGKGGDGAFVILSTDSGDIFTPKGTLGATGADGGFFSPITGKGGDSKGQNAGDSGSIGSTSSGGAGGFIQIISKTGDVTIGGVLLTSGGSTYGGTSTTGDGGKSFDAIGGKSGMIGIGGEGGKGGKIIVNTGGDILGSEAAIAVGGNAIVFGYSPKTGNGGDGVSAGGDSGSILAAGKAGEGGYIELTSTGGNINSDRLVVSGGVAGNQIEGIFKSKQAMEGLTGNGGKGVTGGSAGRVGDSVDGGKAGTIFVYADKELQTAVAFNANGGFGGDQKGVGGFGGEGVNKGGVGGEVGNAGGGGNGGEITIVVNDGPILQFRDIYAFGGDGGDNSGRGGPGGNVTVGIGASAGKGGKIGNSGNGGDGGIAKLTVIQLDPTKNPQILDYADSNILPSVVSLYGGSGGIQTGLGGNGGNALGIAPKPTVKPFAAGGDGGDVGLSGNGGKGGQLKFSVAAGQLTLFDTNLNGGASGAYFGQGGKGGNGFGKNKAGGAGGQLLKQGDGGEGGYLEFKGTNAIFRPKDTTPITPGPVLITLNGGAAGEYSAAAGDGGDGGGPGGAGGQVGSAGAGGKGGKVSLTAEDDVVFREVFLQANGGERLSIIQISGNGGNASNGTSLELGDGGKAGQIIVSGKSGEGGEVSIACKNAGFSQDAVFKGGTIQVNGGNTNTTTMYSGNGGDAFNTGLGGAGGEIGKGPSASKGGLIKVSTLGDIDYPTLQASGGSLKGSYNFYSGNGGNGGSVFRDAGPGGTIGGMGDAGDGGEVNLSTGADDPLIVTSGDIRITNITALGGSVPNFNAKSGNGGNGSPLNTANAAGGMGGPIRNNGAGGTGGTIKIDTKGGVTGMTLSTDIWDVTGGSVGDYNATGGNGGIGSPANISKTGVIIGGGSGGGGGLLGNNGIAGGGGTISVKAADTAVLFNGNLKADGGKVGDYNGVGGIGGKGGSSGGSGGSTGDGGFAGSGGTIVLDVKNGPVSTQAISANAGTIGDNKGKGGAAATSDITGGEGGSTGGGGLGNGGGTIKVTTKGGAISVTGDVTANGSAGGINFSIATNGSDAVNKGGQGGSVAASGGGGGGSGGLVWLKSESADVSVTGGVSVNAGAGGAQNGKAGNGGNATLTASSAVDKGIGGGGGSIGASGDAAVFGVNTGEIDISGNNTTVTGDLLALGANGGATTSKAGNGGNGIVKGGDGGKLLGTGAGSPGGTIKLTAALLLTTGGTILANAGNGGDQSTAKAGDGGDAKGPGGQTLAIGVGGDGGVTVSTGKGGDGGTILLTYNTKSLAITPTVLTSTLGGLGGAQTTFFGKGGTGPKQNGKDGVINPAGMPGMNGTVTEKVVMNDWDAQSDDTDAHDLKKRKLQLIANEDSVTYADCVVVSHSEARPIAFTELVFAVPNLEQIKPRRSAVDSLIVDKQISAAQLEALKKAGVEVQPTSNGADLSIRKGTVMLAPDFNLRLRTEHGVLELGAGSRVIVSVADNCTVVRNLHDRKKGDVRFVSGTQKVDLHLGMQLFVSSDPELTLNDLSKASGIALRNTSSFKLAAPHGTLPAHLSEFSVLTALSKDETLKALYQSNEKADRKIYEQIAKNACILGTLTMRKGPYSAGN